MSDTWDPNDHFDCTPRQYHGGLDKLWDALGLKSVQDEDVFTLAARSIKRGRIMERIARTQRQMGSLRKILLYPCPIADCNSFSVEEWYAKDDGVYFKVTMIETDGLDGARAIYSLVLGRLEESHYIQSTDSYSSRNEADNFIVTGSYARCLEHICQ
jgi:hypothetical protein